MHFFLQGEPGIGKSWMIRDALQPYQEAFAGYGVQRLFQGKELMGFCVKDIRQDFACRDRHLEQGETVVPGRDGVFLYQGQMALPVLERMIQSVYRDCKNQGRRMVLLDEIGGGELESDFFMETLYSILKGDKPCIGVLKSAENLRRMAQRRGLGPDFMERHSALERFLGEHGMLLTMTEGNRGVCAECLDGYIREHISGK